MDTNNAEIKKIFKWVWVALIILSIFLAVETLGAFKKLRSIDPMYNSLSVSGIGEAVSVPDIAVFSFVVSADAPTAGDAQEQVTNTMDVILAKLKALGIEEKDIKTTGYYLRPKYTFRRTSDGYTASHNVAVKVRSTKDVGRALALAGENGATGLSNISFTVDNPDKILDQARAEAIINAQEKAKLLAKELGVRLVRIVSFYDNTGGGIMPYGAEDAGADMVKVSSAPVPTIPTGENKINVSVTIVYEIR